MFEAMMRRFEEETVRWLYLMQLVEAGGRPVQRQPEMVIEGDHTRMREDGDGHGRRRAQTTIDDLEEAFLRKKKRELEQARMAGSGDMAPVQQVRRSGEKVGRNDPCPCGSGKKYKKCCGA